VHLVAPNLSDYDPFLHFSQTTAPVLPTNEPTGHSVHFLDPPILVYVPTLHGLHLTAPVTSLY